MKNPLVILIVVIIVALGLWYVLSPREEGNVIPTPTAAAEIPEGATVITLTEDGYVPRELTIAKGTVVAFVTENGKLFWPASNLHPSHSIYPEFDPKLPVQPDEVWSFMFEQSGEWKYHDHLAPYYTGVITVTE
jgi:plastocyanin